MRTARKHTPASNKATSNTPFEFNPFDNNQPPELNMDTIRDHHSKFEYRSAMECESETRQEYLYHSDNPDAHELYNKLQHCNEDEPCNSMACPICNMQNRLHFINTANKILHKHEGRLVFVTYIDYLNETFGDDPRQIDARKTKEQLRCYLKDAGINVLAIGCFEVDYDMNRNSWIPHIHAVMQITSAKQKNALRRSINKSHLHTREGIHNRPLVIINEIYYLIGLLCYIYKFMPQARISRLKLEINTWGKYIKKTAQHLKKHSWKTRLREEHAVNMLLMMDQYTMKDFEFRYGVRRNKRSLSLIDKSRPAE